MGLLTRGLPLLLSVLDINNYSSINVRLENHARNSRASRGSYAPI